VQLARADTGHSRPLQVSRVAWSAAQDDTIGPIPKLIAAATLQLGLRSMLCGAVQGRHRRQATLCRDGPCPVVGNLGSSCENKQMISAQDAPGFCLAMAQIIPTLLVAVFVADRTLSLAPTGENVEEAAERKRDQAERERRQIEIRERLTTQHSKAISRLKTQTNLRQQMVDNKAGLIERRNQLVEASPGDPAEDKMHGLLLELDSAIERADELIAELNAEIDVSSDRIDGIKVRLDENSQVPEEAERHAAPKSRIQGWYKYSLGIQVLAGLVGESFALLGALHWPQSDYEGPVFASTLAVIWILGLMAQNAWLRIGPEFGIRDGSELGSSTAIKGTLAIAIIMAISMVLLGVAVSGLARDS
jgi:hypothetical protein